MALGDLSPKYVCGLIQRTLKKKPNWWHASSFQTSLSPAPVLITSFCLIRSSELYDGRSIQWNSFPSHLPGGKRFCTSAYFKRIVLKCVLRFPLFCFIDKMWFLRIVNTVHISNSTACHKNVKRQIWTTRFQTCSSDTKLQATIILEWTNVFCFRIGESPATKEMAHFV